MKNNGYDKLYYSTPLIPSYPLQRVMGCEVYLKLECLQPSGSFKNRGIGVFCEHHVRQGIKRFVSSSGGNAGLATAFAGRQLGAEVTVVVPESTSEMMIGKIRDESAQVIIHGEDWQAADVLAREVSDQSQGCYVPPFDHPLIWKGHATMVKEVAETGLVPDAVVVAVGGGGLLCGVIEGMQDVEWNHIPLYAVETAGAASYASALKAGGPVEIEKITSVAKSLGARKVAKQAYEYSLVHPIHSKIVTDDAAVRACRHFANDHRLLVEPACGAALSLCYEKDSHLQKCQKILVVVCGGCSIER